jgi:hypothetical protein
MPFDVTADPAVYASEIYRECYRTVLAKIAARQLGEAFVDLHLEEQPLEFLEAA